MDSNLHKKLIVVSKICIYGIIAQLYVYTFAFAVGGNAQPKSVDEIPVSIGIRGSANLFEVLEKIERTTEFKFSYINEELGSYTLNFDLRFDNLGDLLRAISLQSGLSFKRVDETIYIKHTAQKSEPVIEEIIREVQVTRLTGQVTDENGEPLPGATVAVKGTASGTITDVDGRYSLEVPENAQSLVFSFVGYKTQEVSLNGQTVIDISLEVDFSSLEEVVVVGYGTMKKSDVTGSSVSADLNAFKESPNVSVLQSLQGSVPGLTIGQINQAGQEASINIRGTSTLNGSSSPLIVVDGMMFNGRFSDINPADIKSVEILKDASSKAIYGSLAANGVILITTKSGKTDSKPTVSYSGSFSISNPTVKTELLNREDFLRKVRDLEWRDAYTEESGYTEINPDWDYSLSELNPIILDGLEAGTDFDWYDAVTRPASISNHTLSISGGSNNTSYYFSTGYTDQKGFIENDDYSRATFRLNLDTDIASWLKIGANTSGTFTDFSGDYPTMADIVRTAPLVKPKDENGEFIINPVGDLNQNLLLTSTNDNLNKQNRFVGNFYAVLSAPWVEGLTYRLNFGNNLKNFRDFGSSEFGAGGTGFAYKNLANQYEQTLDNIINYTRQFDDHHVNATFVYGYNKAQYERSGLSGSGFPDLILSYNNVGLAETQEIESSAWEESYLYQMVRIAYSYKSRYLLTATMRRDGFSAFSESNKTALFPSIGLGWIISEESFLNNPNIDFLKLRFSYGENGNRVGRYSSLAVVEATPESRYVFGDGGPSVVGRSVKSLANNDLKWEKTVGSNYGVDFELFKSRLTGNIEYYNSNTENLLWQMVLPQTSGFSSTISNIGEINNKGLEFFIEGSPIKSDNISWRIGLNYYRNQNKIVKLLGQDQDGDGREDDLISSGLFIGESIGTIYDYEVTGIWQVGEDIPEGYDPGSYKIVDQNEDGLITAEDDRVILGHSEPAYQFGVQNTVEYKQFTFKFFINSIQGGQDGYMRGDYPTGGFLTKGTATNANWFDLYDYWAPTRPNAVYANPWVASPVNNSRRYFQRNFVRLQDVSLSYNVPNSLLDKWNVRNAKIYVSGKNLFVFTKWNGWDPETGQGIAPNNPFPVLRSYTIGVDLSF